MLADDTGVEPTPLLLLCPHALTSIVIPITEIDAIRFGVAGLANRLIFSHFEANNFSEKCNADMQTLIPGL
jgi:hypothetical protein